MYSSALDGYSRAAALDPGWEDAREREKQLLNYLNQVTMLMENKVREMNNDIVYTAAEQAFSVHFYGS